MKAVLLYSGHAIAERSHDNHVRIDTYEEYTVCYINGVANIYMDLIIIILIGAEWVWLRCGLVVRVVA